MGEDQAGGASLYRQGPPQAGADPDGIRIEQDRPGHRQGGEAQQIREKKAQAQKQQQIRNRSSTEAAAELATMLQLCCKSLSKIQS